MPSAQGKAKKPQKRGDDVSSVVLRNRGVRVVLAAVDEYGDVIWEDADGKPVDPDEVDDCEPRRRKAWLRFTANSAAALEERFGSSEEMQAELEEKTFSTLRACFAEAFGVDDETMGSMMLEDQFLEYQVAFGAAWAMAQGSDPTVAAEIITRGRKQLREAQAQAIREIEKAIAAEAASPGESGSTPGSASDDQSTSSGASAPDR